MHGERHSFSRAMAAAAVITKERFFLKRRKQQQQSLFLSERVKLVESGRWLRWRWR